MYILNKLTALLVLILLTGVLSSQSYAQCGSMGQGQSSAAGHDHNQMPEGYRGQPGTMNSADSLSAKTSDKSHLNQDNHSMHSCCKSSGAMRMGNADSTSSIVRKGIIDMNLIDANRDGKVFQDQMDWNVISDEPGACPLCKMELLDVTVGNAVKNLKANGFQVKTP